MIYWFTGQPSSGKTTLGTNYIDFYKLKKKLRKSVFHIDGDETEKVNI